METLAEAKLVIMTSLPTNTVGEFAKQCAVAEEVLDRLESLIESIYSPNGQYHKPGFIVTLNRN